MASCIDKEILRTNVLFSMIVLSLLIVLDEKGDKLLLTNKNEYEYIKKSLWEVE